MNEKKPFNIWDGIFENFAATNATATAFEDKVWLDKVTERTKTALSAATGDGIPPVAVTTDYALPFVAALVSDSGSIRILDFGGGAGATYIPLRLMLPSSRAIQFTVVENEAICRLGMEIFADNPEIQFRTSLPVEPAVFDIVHFGSSIHYVDDWMSVMRAILALKPKYVLFSDLPAAGNASFVTVQNYYDARIPVRFWNLDEFVRAVEGLGLMLLMRSRYRGNYLPPGSELPTGNFDEEHRLHYTSQLIFGWRQ